MTALPPLARSLCDDAAVFPPGSMPLSDAVAAHRRHVKSTYAELVGPLVIAAHALDEIGELLVEGELLDITVTTPAGARQLPDVLTAVSRLPLRLAAVEVALPAGQRPRDFFHELDRASAEAGNVRIFVEVPRDERRDEVVGRCASARYRAKFRTGGVRADLYPDETELAGAIQAVVRADVSFKATAGLHHAVRNTDPDTGFQQHGFLNVLLATDAAERGAGTHELSTLLGSRDQPEVAEAVAALDATRVAAVRSRFLSFGTCSISEPLAELAGLGLIPTATLSGEGS